MNTDFSFSSLFVDDFIKINNDMLTYKLFYPVYI